MCSYHKQTVIQTWMYSFCHYDRQLYKHECTPSVTIKDLSSNVKKMLQICSQIQSLPSICQVVRRHTKLLTYFKWQYTRQAGFLQQLWPNPGTTPLLWRTEEKHTRTSNRTAMIWNRHLSHVSLKCYHYTSPFCYYLPIWCSNLFTRSCY